MVKVYAIDGITPVVHPESFVHPTASIIGDVIIGAGCYVGPGASIRGDLGRIVLEDGCNVQDNCVLHGFPGIETRVETNGHIGHGAVVHACRIGRNALVGMNAVVMDAAVVGENAVVAAMAFVKAGSEVPPGVLFAGIPGRVVRALTAEEIEWKSKGTGLYQTLAQRCRDTLTVTESLDEPEADRRRIDDIDMLPLHLHRGRSEAE